MGSNEREIRPTDRPVRVERNRWFKRFLITAIVITRERALLSLGCATFNSGIRTFLPPVESPSLLLFSPPPLTSLIITGRTWTDQLRVQCTRVRSSHRAATDFRISRRERRACSRQSQLSAEINLIPYPPFHLGLLYNLCHKSK
jgi:hypothetical protein